MCLLTWIVQTCRLGGIPNDDCPGPCNKHALDKGHALFDSPQRAARTWKRGQAVNIKYQRNNHGPGGFTRLTLVPWKFMMNKRIHTRNAFHFSCWGANAVGATRTQTQKDNMRFSIAGNDGEEHRFRTAFYSTRAVVPDCIPDGAYVLGWVWYGGTGSPVSSSARQQEPLPYGFFADYWACASVHIKGGKPLKQKCSKRFVNDMGKYSKDGCMAMNNRPGVCNREPCMNLGSYRKPAEFARGKAPPLYSRYFSGPGYDAKKAANTGDYAGQSACHCLALNWDCVPEISRYTKGACLPRSKLIRQKDQCITSCCKWCLKNRNHAYCKGQLVRNLNRRLGRKCTK